MVYIQDCKNIIIRDEFIFKKIQRINGQGNDIYFDIRQTIFATNTLGLIMFIV